MENMRIEFGEMVHTQRLKKGLSQEQLAEQLDTCCVSIRKIEQGRGNANMRLYFMLCCLLDIDTRFLQEKYVAPYLRERVKDTGIDIMM